jgi:hypothetical protein
MWAWAGDLHVNCSKEKAEMQFRVNIYQENKMTWSLERGHIVWLITDLSAANAAAIPQQ